ncbi:MAG: hypothetical protein ACR2KT_14390 [Methylocella sp.]
MLACTPNNYIETLGAKGEPLTGVSVSVIFECSEQPQSHKNRSNYEYCVVRDPSKQTGKVQAPDERSSIFSEEPGDSGNNFVKPLQRYYVVRLQIQIP